MIAVWVVVAGGGGALARFVVDGVIRARWASDLPWATIVINVSGSLLLGVLTGLVVFRGDPNTLKLVAGTGFCGGYTTFSTASFETVRLVQRGALVAAVGNAFGTLGLTLGAGALGLLLTH